MKKNLHSRCDIQNTKKKCVKEDHLLSYHQSSDFVVHLTVAGTFLFVAFSEHL